VAVASYNVLAPVYDHSDIVCAEDDIVFELELAVEVHYEEVCSAAAFASINIEKYTSYMLCILFTHESFTSLKLINSTLYKLLTTTMFSIRTLIMAMNG